jgi:hypothetical protein
MKSAREDFVMPVETADIDLGALVRIGTAQFTTDPVLKRKRI